MPRLGALAKRRQRQLQCIAALGIATLSLAINLRGLGHGSLTYWDESFHAVVARNLLDHPLRPTLVDEPYFEGRNWSETHLWLHKPPGSLWTAAASMKMLGVSTLALRLPSAILAAAATLLTFLTGRLLFRDTVGLIAAAAQAFLPAIALLVRGLHFSDMVDVALLFWTQLALYALILAMRTGHHRYAVLAGLAQGGAWLSKSYLALLITGLAMSLWILFHLKWVRGRNRFDGRLLFVCQAAFIATVMPWTIFAWSSYPDEFVKAELVHLAHLHSEVQIWGAPWDRLVFDYLPFLVQGYFLPIVASLVYTACAFWTRRRVIDAVLLLWFGGVLLPHLAAATKTPTSTLIGVPAALMMLAAFVAGSSSSPWIWSRVAISSILPGIWIAHPGYWTTGGLRGAGWLGRQVLSALVVLTLLLLIDLTITVRRRDGSNDLRRLCAAGSVILLLVPLSHGIRRCLNLYEVHQRRPQFEGVPAVGRLPSNSVFLFDRRIASSGIYNELMFWTGRPAYKARGANLPRMIRDVRRQGGRPFVVWADRLPCTDVWHEPTLGGVVHECNEADLARLRSNAALRNDN